jgi:hypothetical protein
MTCRPRSLWSSSRDSDRHQRYLIPTQRPLRKHGAAVGVHAASLNTSTTGHPPPSRFAEREPSSSTLASERRILSPLCVLAAAHASTGPVSSGETPGGRIRFDRPSIAARIRIRVRDRIRGRHHLSQPCASQRPHASAGAVPLRRGIPCPAFKKSVRAFGTHFGHLEQSLSRDMAHVLAAVRVRFSACPWRAG